MGFADEFPEAVPVTAMGVRTIAGYDAGNRPIYTTEDRPVGQWVLWPASSDESLAQQDITTDKLQGFAPPSVDLSIATKVRIDGLAGTFNVQGSPWQWVDPFDGERPGQSVALTRVS